MLAIGGVVPEADPPMSADGRSLGAYLAAVASGTPTPGGGSVMALVAALGAALGGMVAKLTASSAAAGSELGLVAAGSRLDEVRERLLPLAAADEAAYGRYREAAALPKGNDGARSARTAAMQAALVGAADVPLAVAEACVALGESLEPVARFGNRHLLADARIAAWLTEAALRGALLNVRGNADLLRDTERRDQYRRRADELEAAGQSIIGRVLAAIDERARG